MLCLFYELCKNNKLSNKNCIFNYILWSMLFKVSKIVSLQYWKISHVWNLRISVDSIFVTGDKYFRLLKDAWPHENHERLTLLMKEPMDPQTGFVSISLSCNCGKDQRTTAYEIVIFHNRVWKFFEAWGKYFCVRELNSEYYFYII